MKKKFLVIFKVLSIILLISCNSKTSNLEEEFSSSAEQTESKLMEEETKSNAKLSFQFNGESFYQKKTEESTSAGMRTSGNKWLINFGGESRDQGKEIGLQFNVENFDLKTGIVPVTICTLSLFGFEDEQLYSKEDLVLEITDVKKIKSESSMGSTINEYSIIGNFHGSFSTITGEKNYKVDNGTFENYTLVEIIKS